jgi:hypothetical protein
MRRITSFVLALCASLVLLASNADCQNTVLYGLNYDGKLIQINKTTASATQVRTQLPTSFGPYLSLAFHDGSFHASYRMGGYSYLIAFGGASGDERHRGKMTATNIGIGSAGALAHHPDGALLMAYFGVPVGMTKKYSLYDVDESTAFCATIPNAFTKSAGDASPGALTFTNGNTAFMLNENSDNYPGYQQRLWKFGRAAEAWSTTSSTFGAFPLGSSGMARDPSNATKIYISSGVRKDTTNQNLGFFTGRLWNINVSGALPTSATEIGTISGFPGVAGIVFGPPIGDVVLPEPPTPPPPPPIVPCDAASCAWESIRMLLENAQ